MLKLKVQKVCMHGRKQCTFKLHVRLECIASRKHINPGKEVVDVLERAISNNKCSSDLVKKVHKTRKLWVTARQLVLKYNNTYNSLRIKSIICEQCAEVLFPSLCYILKLHCTQIASLS